MPRRAFYPTPRATFGAIRCEVVATHYDILGVRASATPEQIRRAYHDKAREMHPDGYAELPEVEAASRRAMQDVNEAWRVLRDPASRAGYDRALRQPPAVAPRAVQMTDDLDRPYPRRLAEPGDITLSFVRAAPWVAVLIVLGAIVVFTAFARRGDDTHSLIGKCINTSSGVPAEAPCDEPNDGYVMLIVDRESRCPEGSIARVVAGGDWYCLRPEKP